MNNFLLLLTLSLVLANQSRPSSATKFDGEIFKKIFKFNGNYKDGIKYKDCGSVDGVINSITVTDCTDLPCKFERGKNYTLSLNLNSKVNTNRVTNEVYGVIAKIPVPFHLPNSDGCTMGITCPVKNGDVLTELVTLPVLSEYPRLSLYVKWQVLDDSSKMMACFIFPVQIL